MKTYKDIIAEVSKQKCWRPWRGYGAAIFFELGEKLIDTRSGEARQGAFTISLDLCDWEIIQNGQVLVTSRSPYSEIDLQQLKFKNATLLSITVDEDTNTSILQFEKNLGIRVQLKGSDEWHILKKNRALVFQKDNIFIEKDPEDQS